LTFSDFVALHPYRGWFVVFLLLSAGVAIPLGILLGPIGAVLVPPVLGLFVLLGWVGNKVLRFLMS